MSLTFPAQEYPTGIFQQTTPDETQELSDSPRFNTLAKDWLTRSEIYGRLLPDGETMESCGHNTRGKNRISVNKVFNKVLEFIN